eukprot:5047515-Prymnesium_polylepis.1
MSVCTVCDDCATSAVPVEGRSTLRAYRERLARLGLLPAAPGTPRCVTPPAPGLRRRPTPSRHQSHAPRCPTSCPPAPARARGHDWARARARPI